VVVGIGLTLRIIVRTTGTQVQTRRINNVGNNIQRSQPPATNRCTFAPWRLYGELGIYRLQVRQNGGESWEQQPNIAAGLPECGGKRSSDIGQPARFEQGEDFGTYLEYSVHKRFTASGPACRV
jgi:hypothetical protein